MTLNRIVTAAVGPLEVHRVTFKTFYLMWKADWGASSGLILNLSTRRWGKKKHKKAVPNLELCKGQVGEIWNWSRAAMAGSPVRRGPQQPCRTRVLWLAAADFNREKNKDPSTKHSHFSAFISNLFILPPSSHRRSWLRSAWRLSPALSLTPCEHTRALVSAPLWGLPFILRYIVAQLGLNLEPHCTSWGHTSPLKWRNL